MLINFGVAKGLLRNSGFNVFRYPEYRLFWVAAAFSNIGMWALIYGRLWLMHQLTDSPLMVGLVSTASLGPVLLFSVWGGAIADRVNRLRLVRWTRGMFAALAVLTGLLIFTDVIQAWHVFAVSAATGVLLAFDIPSRSAMIPALVPRAQLASAIALYSLVFGGAAIVGPAILSPLVDLWGLDGVFFFIGAAYALTVLFLMLMSPSGHKPMNRSVTVVRGIIEGFQYVRNHTTILGVLAISIVAGVFGNSFEALLPVYADKILAGGIGTYSRLLLSAGVGGLIATITIAVLGTRVRPVWFFVSAGIGYGLGILALSQLSWFPGAALNLGMIGAFHVVFSTMSITLVQTLTADQFRGRIMGIQQLSWGATAVGGAVMGAMAEAWGVAFALSLGGLILAVATVAIAAVSLRGSNTREIEAHPKPAV